MANLAQRGPFTRDHVTSATSWYFTERNEFVGRGGDESEHLAPPTSASICATIVSGDQRALGAGRCLPPLPGNARRSAGFAPGNRVRVCSGPMRGCFGLYAGMAPRDRVLILLQMLRRERD